MQPSPLAFPRAQSAFCKKLASRYYKYEGTKLPLGYQSSMTAKTQMRATKCPLPTGQIAPIKTTPHSISYGIGFRTRWSTTSFRFSGGTARLVHLTRSQMRQEMPMGSKAPRLVRSRSSA